MEIKGCERCSELWNKAFMAQAIAHEVTIPETMSRVSSTSTDLRNHLYSHLEK